MEQVTCQLNKELQHKRVGLALGSGSARGWAHIGVLQALSELGIRVDYVAGTSIGALVGAFYASQHINDLKNLALQLDWKQIIYFFDVVFPKSGLIDGKKVTDFIGTHIGELNIEQLSLPFSVVTTDLTTGKEVVISSGGIIEAVRSSISVPGIFTPVENNGMFLVDGGLVNPVPVNVVREMGADFIIAVDLNYNVQEQKRTIMSTPEKPRRKASNNNSKNHERINHIWKMLDEQVSKLDISLPSYMDKWLSEDITPNIFEVLMSSINVMEAQITETRLLIDPPEILIRPSLGHIRLLEFNRAQEAIDDGYNQTMSQFNSINNCSSDK